MLIKRYFYIRRFIKAFCHQHCRLIRKVAVARQIAAAGLHNQPAVLFKRYRIGKADALHYHRNLVIAVGTLAEHIKPKVYFGISCFCNFFHKHPCQLKILYTIYFNIF